MKKIVLSILATSTVLTSSAFAMSNEQMGECVMKETMGRTQILYGLVQQVVESKEMSEAEALGLMALISKPEVVTCKQLDALMAQSLADVLKRTP